MKVKEAVAVRAVMVNRQNGGIERITVAKTNPWLNRIAFVIGMGLLVFPFLSRLLPAPVRAYLGAIFR